MPMDQNFTYTFNKYVVQNFTSSMISINTMALPLEQLTDETIAASSLAEELYAKDMKAMGYTDAEILRLLEDVRSANPDFGETYIEQRNSLMDAPYAAPLAVRDYIVKADDVSGVTTSGVDLSFEKPYTKVFLSEDKQVLGKVSMRRVGGNIVVHEEQYAPIEEVVSELSKKSSRKLSVEGGWQKYVTAGLATLAFFTLTNDLLGQANVDVHTVDHDGAVLAGTQVYLRDIDGVLVDSLVTDASGNGTFNNVTGVTQEQWNAVGYDLMVPYPNPFLQSAKVRFSIGDEVPVWLGLYNSNGELEGVLVNEILPAGTYEAVLGSQRASGVHFLDLIAGQYRETQKSVLVKKGSPVPDGNLVTKLGVPTRTQLGKTASTPYTLIAVAPGHAAVNEDVSIVGNDSFTLQLGEGYTISGQLMGANSNPDEENHKVGNVVVRYENIMTLNPYIVEVMSSADGRFWLGAEITEYGYALGPLTFEKLGYHVRGYEYAHGEDSTFTEIMIESGEDLEFFQRIMSFFREGLGPIGLMKPDTERFGTEFPAYFVDQPQNQEYRDAAELVANQYVSGMYSGKYTSRITDNPDSAFIFIHYTSSGDSYVVHEFDDENDPNKITAVHAYIRRNLPYQHQVLEHHLKEMTNLSMAGDFLENKIPAGKEYWKESMYYQSGDQPVNLEPAQIDIDAHALQLKLPKAYKRNEL